MIAYTRYIELIFPDQADPADVEIVEPATYDRPGQARLNKARTSANGIGWRVYSANGGAFIGIIIQGQPEPPYNFTYWLVEPEPEAAQAGPGDRAQETRNATP